MRSVQYPVDLRSAVETLRSQHRAVGRAVAVQHTGPPGDPWLDLRLDDADLVLWSMRGGRFEATYPPAMFRPVARTIVPGLPVPPSAGGAHVVEIGSELGRSADGDLPFFLLSSPDGSHGLWFAVGHTGFWRARLEKLRGECGHRLVVTGLTGGPTDELLLPSVIVGAYEGDGWAAVKAFLAEQRRRPLAPPVIYNTWFNVDGDVDEASCLHHVDVAAALGIEVFVVDAGWYGGSGTDFSGPGLGTFDVDRAKFPNGLEAVADAAHAAGMRFGLWVEPERAHPDSRVATDHPAAMRSAPGQRLHLVDFGHAEVREWAFDLVASLVERLGLDWVKWDFNIHHLLPYWDGDLAAELAHHRGVYEVVDRIRATYPDVVYEHVSSGGNRLDVEMIGRADITALSDQVQSPEIVRAYVGGAARWLPAQYRFAGLSPQVVWQDGEAVTAARVEGAYRDDYLLSSVAGTTGFFEPISVWSAATRERIAAHIARFKEIRHLLDGTFRHFRDAVDVPLAGWEAWELADETTGEALLVAFRQRSSDATRTFSGFREWTVTLPPDGAVLLHTDRDADPDADAT